MKKYFTIVILVVLLILTNLLLFVKQYENQVLVDKNKQLSEELSHIVEISKLIEQVNQDNLAQSYQLIQINEAYKQELANITQGKAKVCIRFHVNDCPPCINSLKAFIKSLGKEIGSDKIILFPIYQKHKELVMLKREFASFVVVDIPNDDFHVENADQMHLPYLFIYNRPSRYPGLFFFFQTELTDLNQRYKQSIIHYFKQESE